MEIIRKSIVPSDFLLAELTEAIVFGMAHPH